MTYFSIACGALTAINAALLQRIGGVAEGSASILPGFAIAVIEALILLALVDRFFMQGRNSRRASGADRTKTLENEIGEAGKADWDKLRSRP